MRLALVFALLAACGPAGAHDDDVDPTEPCTPGDVVDCYSGATGTKGVGPCDSSSETALKISPVKDD